MITFFELIGNYHFIIGIFYIIPLVLCLKYYIQFKISDYLLLVIYFIYWLQEGFAWKGMDIFSIFPQSVGFALNDIDALPLYIIAVRAVDQRRLWMYIVGSIPILLTLIVVFDTNNTIIIGIFPLHFWVSWFARLYYHSFIGIVFYRSKKLNDIKRIRWSKNLWILHSILWVFPMVIFIINNGILQHPQDGSGPIWLVYVILTPISLAAAIIMILHIFYPEAVLITYEQLHRAKKLYNIVLTHNPVKDFGLSTLKNYMDSIPKELRDKINTSKD
jgi:hypothetical protein